MGLNKRLTMYLDVIEDVGLVVVEKNFHGKFLNKI